MKCILCNNYLTTTNNQSVIEQASLGIVKQTMSHCLCCSTLKAKNKICKTNNATSSNKNKTELYT